MKAKNLAEEQEPSDENHTLPVCNWDPYCCEDSTAPLSGNDVAETDKLKGEHEKLVAENKKLRTLLDKALHDRLCLQHLCSSMQKGKEETNRNMQNVLNSSLRKCLEKGYKDVEKLSPECFALSSLAFSWFLIAS